MLNSIGQEINVGDRVLHVSRHGSRMTFKVGHVISFGERQSGYNYRTHEPRIEPTVLINYDEHGNVYGPSRGVGLDKVFKLA